MDNQLIYRELSSREVNTDTRSFSGMAVPYGVDTELVPGLFERFERGGHTVADNAVVYAQHNHREGFLPVGKLDLESDTDDGIRVRGRLSQTAAGDEVYTLLQDDVIKGLSIGFRPGKTRRETDESGNEYLIRESSTIAEVSVTPWPQYEQSQVASVRENWSSSMDRDQRQGQASSETDQPAGDGRSDGMDELEQRMTAMEDEMHTGHADTAKLWRSGGEHLKALVSGDEDAIAAFRAADTTPPAKSGQSGAEFANGGNWMDRQLRFVEKRRALFGLFDQAPLPDSGNTVEYPYVGSVAGEVGKQSSEAADLSYMEVQLASGSANVGTYGGYSKMSRQAIERSSESYLDAVLRYQALQYAVATNAATRTAFTGMTAGKTLTPAGNSVSDWITTVIDAYVYISENSLGLTADFMVCDATTFKKIASLTDNDGRPVFGVSGQSVNSLGTANLAIPRLSIQTLPVVLDPGMSAGTVRIASSGALSILESPGAPFRLSDDNIVALTREFSLYGYAAWTQNDSNGVVKVASTNL